MLVISLHINILYLAAIVFVAFIAGYLLRGAQIRKQQKKIYELEQEMLSNHAQILDLEREYAILMKRLERSEKPNRSGV